MARGKCLNKCKARLSRVESTEVQGETTALTYESFASAVPPPPDSDPSESDDDDEEEEEDDTTQDPPEAPEVHVEPYEPSETPESFKLSKRDFILHFLRRLKASLRKSASSAIFGLKTGLFLVGLCASKVSMYIVDGVKFIAAVVVCTTVAPAVVIFRLCAR
ncbi:hypothetical protein BJY01DRAFT_254765 [Aspergillus pseudoustus]|uniref:Uncharacterized protein n=1 Tax=Aspergillus pseudoustus TaxID=1810923 RepID=A0ABR4ITH3_9EURO